jgi:predicted MFS family arabinose efflux permease
MVAIATNQQIDVAMPNSWSAVGSMTLCVAMLIASEFLPVSLLTPIAIDLRTTQGMAGQAISISGLFAVVASLFIATIAGRFDRGHVLIVLMLASLVLIAEAHMAWPTTKAASEHSQRAAFGGLCGLAQTPCSVSMSGRDWHP